MTGVVIVGVDGTETALNAAASARERRPKSSCAKLINALPSSSSWATNE
ncbi:hypothetical protein [Paenarthrobacter sp. NPDC090522]